MVCFKLICCHNEITYRLKHWLFERIVLWKVNGNAPRFFVATPDGKLCLEPCECWTDWWTTTTRLGLII